MNPSSFASPIMTFPSTFGISNRATSELLQSTLSFAAYIQAMAFLAFHVQMAAIFLGPFLDYNF